MSVGDWYLDPPEYDGPDLPDCPTGDCEGWGEWERETDGGKRVILTCCDCGHEWSIDNPCDQQWADWDDAIDLAMAGTEDVDLPDEPEDPNCPHGNPWGGCGTCDYLGDIAYDAWREGRR